MMRTHSMTLYRHLPGCLCSLLLLVCHSIHAGQTDEFVVTNSNNAGPGSLRDAIAMANASSNDVEITFDESVTGIDITTGPLELTNGNYVIIEGSATTGLSLDANNNSRILVATNPDSLLEIRNVTFLDGMTTAAGTQPATCAPGTGHGGALCTLGNLTLRDVQFARNTTTGDAAHGGAVYIGGNSNSRIRSSSGLATFTTNMTQGQGAHGGAVYVEQGRLTTSSVSLISFSQNSAIGPLAMGGAIFARQYDSIAGVSPGSTVFVENSASFGGAFASSDCDTNISELDSLEFISNEATSAGGAVFIGVGCDAEITRSQFNDNRCDDMGGGAIATDNVVFISQSIFESNSCIAPGGAIYGANIELTNSNILRNNQTNGNGHHGGAIAADNLLLANSTVAFNSTNAAAANGGAIWAIGDLDIRNSTITGNEASGIQSNGGALYYSGDGQGLMISNSTIIDNQAGGAAAGVFYSPDLAMQKSDLTLISSVIADNDNDNFLLINDGFGHEINVIQSVFGDISAEINGSNVANIFNNGPAFDSLDDNGCFEPAGLPGADECPQTYMPDTGSVVLDSGDNPNSEISDQRGFTFPRTFNGATDIGAIEVSPEPSVSTSPAAVNFGTYIVDPANDDESRTITIESNGPGILHILDITENSTSTTTATDCGLQLAAGDSCEVIVVLETDEFILSQPEVTIDVDAPDSPLIIPVIANPITGAELQSNPDSVQFQDTPVDVPSPIETLTLTNSGSRPLEIVFAIASGQFDVVNNGCTQPVAPFGGSCDINLQFIPNGVGIVMDELRVRSNSVTPNNDTFIPLVGTSGIVFFDGFE